MKSAVRIKECKRTAMKAGTEKWIPLFFNK